MLSLLLLPYTAGKYQLTLWKCKLKRRHELTDPFTVTVLYYMTTSYDSSLPHQVKLSLFHKSYCSLVINNTLHSPPTPPPNTPTHTHILFTHTLHTIYTITPPYTHNYVILMYLSPNVQRAETL